MVLKRAYADWTLPKYKSKPGGCKTHNTRMEVWWGTKNATDMDGPRCRCDGGALYSYEHTLLHF